MGGTIQSNRPINANVDVTGVHRVGINEVGIEGVTHDEKLSVGSMGRSAFSFTSLGLTAYAGISAYLLAKPYWDKFPEHIRKVLSKPMPWEGKSQSTIAKYTASTKLKKRTISDIVTQHHPYERKVTVDKVSNEIVTEISTLYNALSANHITIMYRNEAIDEVTKYLVATNRVPAKDLGSIILIDDFSILRRYRNVLKKYMRIYNIANRRLARNYMWENPTSKTAHLLQTTETTHKSILNEFKSRSIPVEFDFSGLSYNRVLDIPQPVMRQGKITRASVRDWLANAGDKITWKDRDIFQRMGDYSKLPILQTDTAVSGLVGKLDKALYSTARAMRKVDSNTVITDLYKIEMRAVNQGSGDMAVSILLRLKSELNDTWINQEVVIPLGNNGGVRLKETGLKYVGRLYQPSGRSIYLDPTGQMCKLVGDHVSDIMSDMVQDKPGASGWDREVRAAMMQRLTPAGSKITDEGVRLTITKEDYELLARPLEATERSRITRELQMSRRRLKSLVMTNPNHALIPGIQARVELMERQLGQHGFGTPEKMHEVFRLMQKESSESEILYSAWESSSSHFYQYKLLDGSIFGASPWATTAVPQASVQQFWNVYELSEKLDYPITWEGDGTKPFEGKGPLRFDNGYTKARVGLVGDIYPFNEAFTPANPKFLKKFYNISKMHAGGERSYKRITMDDYHKIKVNPKLTNLHRLIRDIQSAGGAKWNPDVVDQIIKSSPTVVIQPNMVLGDMDLEDMTNGNHPSIVRNIVVDAENKSVYVELERTDTSSIRAKSLAGLKSPLISGDIALADSYVIDANRPIDVILTGKTTKKLAMEQFQSMRLADALDGLRDDIKANDKIIRSIKYGETEKLIAANKNTVLKTKLGLVARNLGGTYNAISGVINLPGVFTPGRTKLTKMVVDQVFTDIGYVYSPEQAEKINRMFDKHVKPMLDQYIDTEGLPKGWEDTFRPGPGRAVDFRFVDYRMHKGAEPIRILTPVLLDTMGIFKQTHEDMLKTWGLKTGVNAGIPFRWTELQQLMNKYLTSPTPIVKDYLEATEKYAAYLAGQMGGTDAMKELNNIITSVFGGKLPAGTNSSQVIDMMNNTDFMDKLKNTMIPEKMEEAWVITDEHHNFLRIVDNMDEAHAVMAIDPNSVHSVPAYRIPTEKLGIFHPETGYLDKWVKLPYEIPYDFAGYKGKSEYVRITDPNAIKVKPQIFSGPNGSYTILPSDYVNSFRIFEAVRDSAGSSAPQQAISNASIQVQAIIRDSLIGRNSLLKKHGLMTYEPGIQGIMMPFAQPYMHGGEIKYTSGVNELYDPKSGRRIKLDTSRYGPQDIVVSRKAFNGVKDVIRNQLEEEYMDPVTKVPNKLLVDQKLKDIAEGKQWTTSVGVRFPKTGSHSSINARLWVEPKLDKVGTYADFLYVGELVQKALWGDYDFDQIMIMLARHYDGISGIKSLLDDAGKHSDWKIYEGTPEYEYMKMGETTYGTPMAIDKYRTTLKLRRGEKLEGIALPRIYRVVPIDKESGLRIAVFQEETERDPISGKYRKYYGNKVVPFVDKVTGHTVDFQPGEWVEYIAQTIDEGKELTMSDHELMRTMPPEVQAMIRNNKKYSTAIKVQQARQYIGAESMAWVKQGVGGANAYAMAMNLAAQNHLNPMEAAQVSHQMALWIESVLKSKRNYGDAINTSMESYGKFIRAMENMTNVEDSFGKILTDTTETGGLGMRESMVKMLAGIPREARTNLYDTGYQLLYGTANAPLSLMNTKMHASLLGAPDEEILAHLRGESRKWTESEMHPLRRGTAIHKMYESRIASEFGPGRTSWERKVVDTDTGVVGRIDMIVEDEQGNKYIHEVKSMKSDMYEKMKNVNSRDKLISNRNVQQLNFYLGRMGSGVKGGFLTYINSDDPTEILNVGDPARGGQAYQFNEVIFNNEMARVGKLQDMVRNERISSKTNNSLAGIISALKGGDSITQQAADMVLTPESREALLGTELPRSSSSYSHFKTKKFMGDIFRRTKYDDTLLADAVGPKWYPTVKYGIWGATMLAGAYVALNFFRPNQMSSLGTMPGLGGEYWSPLKGSRMEMPYHIPIDISEYTWQSPPYDRKKARIELYDPNFEAKLRRRVTQINPSIYPMTNWSIAPKASVVYNRYENSQYNRDNSRSSNMIGR